MALTYANLPLHSNVTDPLENYITFLTTEIEAKADYDGQSNTEKIVAFNTAYGTNTTSYAAPYCKAFVFPNGIGNAYLPSLGELYTICQNKTEIDECLTLAGGTVASDMMMSSTLGDFPSETVRRVWRLWWANKNSGHLGYLTTAKNVYPVSLYQ